jgi:hypothetical protein
VSEAVFTDELEFQSGGSWTSKHPRRDERQIVRLRSTQEIMLNISENRVE